MAEVCDDGSCRDYRSLVLFLFAREADNETFMKRLLSQYTINDEITRSMAVRALPRIRIATDE